MDLYRAIHVASVYTVSSEEPLFLWPFTTRQGTEVLYYPRGFYIMITDNCLIKHLTTTKLMIRTSYHKSETHILTNRTMIGLRVGVHAITVEFSMF